MKKPTVASKPVLAQPKPSQAARLPTPRPIKVKVSCSSCYVEIFVHEKVTLTTFSSDKCFQMQDELNFSTM